MEYLKKYWLILLLALIVRIVIGAFTFHEDVRASATASFVYLKMHELDPYSRSYNIAPQELLNYLPFSYLISLPFHSLGRTIVSDQVERTFLTNQNLLLGQPQMWLYLLYVKIPFIIFDIGVGIVLSLIAGFKYQKKALLLWLFNPFTIWVSSAIGQYDVYLTFFMILSWYLIQQDKLFWSAFVLGLGAATKSAPFLLLPLLLGLTTNFRDKVKVVTLVLIPYLVTVIPYLPSASFRRDALYAPQMQKIFFAQIPLSGGENILIVPAVLLSIYAIYFLAKRTKIDFEYFSILIFLTVFSFSHFHIQWFVWLTPFLIIYCLNNWNKWVKLTLTGLIVSLVGMLFLFESSLQLKVFAPLFPALESARGLHEILGDNQIIFLRSILASLFFASSLLFSINIISIKKVLPHE